MVRSAVVYLLLYCVVFVALGHPSNLRLLGNHGFGPFLGIRSLWLRGSEDRGPQLWVKWQLVSLMLDTTNRRRRAPGPGDQNRRAATAVLTTMAKGRTDGGLRSGYRHGCVVQTDPVQANAARLRCAGLPEHP